ncbi:hypothetical protein O3P69_005464 [Scylla paramamosain]|uniref:Uncharacterized protein n=1 Tax=Scylla paramamosain TaxID=85552 RepID=A0AAW0UB25_SCYPA
MSSLGLKFLRRSIGSEPTSRCEVECSGLSVEEGTRQRSCRLSPAAHTTITTTHTPLATSRLPPWEVAFGHRGRDPMADGGLGTLGNGTAGYLHIPRGPATPPDSIYSGALDSLPGSTVGVTEEAREEESRQERLMRPEGRHHLVDIHGLAVFLRRSTRCLSCRAAFCLYVTGKISAQLAAVTQVKITCQKCNYTTSQTLSKPAGAPDSPSPQPSTPTQPPPPPVPPTPPDTSTSPVRPPPPHCPGKPRHQTPIEKVWVKEEDKQVSPTSPKQDVEVSEDACSPAPPPSAPLAKPHEAPDAAPITSTIIHRHLATLQEANALQKGVSFPSASSFSVVPNPCPAVMPSEGLFTMLSGTATSPRPQDSPQLLQALEIKQKLERDLEESLRLVRRMIQLDPDAAPPSGKKNKETRSAKVYQESLKQPQMYGATGDVLVGSLQPAVISGDLLTKGDGGGGGGSLKSKERRKTTTRTTPRSRGVKESSGRKATRRRAGRGRKCGGGGSDEEDNEGNTSDVQQDASHGSLTPSATPAAHQQCPTRTERCLAGVERGLYDALHHSLPRDTKGQERKGEHTEGGSHRPPQVSHAFPAKHSSSPPSSTSDTLKSNLDAWGHAQRIPEGYSSRKRQRKSTMDESLSGLNQTVALAQILASLQQGTHATASPAGVKEDPTLPLFPCCTRSLTGHPAEESKHAGAKELPSLSPALGVGEEAEEEEEEEEDEAMKGDASSAGGSEKNEAGQEEGRTATWRFHDLLSSDESDAEDGRLVIDTD